MIIIEIQIRLPERISMEWNEALCILKYVEDKINGVERQEPEVGYSIHTTFLEYFRKLFSNEKQMASSTKKIFTILQKNL